MAEPGDPQTPRNPTPDDHDDLIGFTSPSSLAGVGRIRSEPPAPTAAASSRDLFEEPAPTWPAAVPAWNDGPEPVPTTSPWATPRKEPAAVRPFSTPEPTSTPEAAPRPTQAIPDWIRETRSATPAPEGPNEPRFERPPPPEGAMGLYAVYALILCAVPTMGVSAVIALLAVTVRPASTEPFALGHFLFQKRTLWIAGVGAAIGVVLIAVNLGVFVLFLMALWVLVRGTWGVLRLASGKPVANPKTWLI